MRIVSQVNFLTQVKFSGLDVLLIASRDGGAGLDAHGEERVAATGRSIHSRRSHASVLVTLVHERVDHLHARHLRHREVLDEHALLRVLFHVHPRLRVV